VLDRVLASREHSSARANRGAFAERGQN